MLDELIPSFLRPLPGDIACIAETVRLVLASAAHTRGTIDDAPTVGISISSHSLVVPIAQVFSDPGCVA